MATPIPPHSPPAQTATSSIASRLSAGWLQGLMALAIMLCLSVSGLAHAAPASDADAASSSYESLATLLEDPDQREALIEGLRQLDSKTSEQAAEVAGAEVTLSEDSPSLSRQLAEISQELVAELSATLDRMIQTLSGLGNEDASSIDWERFMTEAISLGLVVISTIGLFLILRRLAHPLFSRVSQWSLDGQHRSPLLRTLMAVIIAAIVDVAVIGLAFLGGYLLAIFAYGEQGVIGQRESMFLNAYLVIELVKALMRMLFSSGYQGLRLMPMRDEVARYWNRSLALLAGFIGYGILVVVPMINNNLAPAVGSFVSLLIMGIALIWAIVVISRNRVLLRDRLLDQARETHNAFIAVCLRILARTWHLIALAYFATLFIISQTTPEEALPFMMAATLKTLLAIGGGALLSRVLTQLIGKRIQVSDKLRGQLPMLETRLNSYIPTALRIMRAIILVVVVGMVLNAWSIVALGDWLATDAGALLLSRIFHVLFILAFAVVIWVGIASLIEHKLNPDTGKGKPSSRVETLLALFRNAIAIAMIVFTAMIVLSEIGIDIAPLLAGAGVLGLAIGFGAQKMVQDIITGVFIQLENAINTGDVVTAGGVTGTAERLTIRSVGIRDLSGTFHIVPFSSVDTVSNYMRDFAYHVGEYGISYRENVDHAIVHLRAAFDELQESSYGAEILEPVTIAGVSSLADSSVNIRVMIKTSPGNQWAIGREYNKLVKQHFDAAGIEIPFPHMTMYFGQDKDGGAPPANVRTMHEPFVIDGSAAGQPKTPEQREAAAKVAQRREETPLTRHATKDGEVVDAEEQRIRQTTQPDADGD
ncbi:mechanosensitive channel protein [Cobetia marina]|uniref:mechanosensitive channel protein n=1 Tax=Cobetia marina TaxID=28258 RepID=UPI00146A70F7|nr:mechanosensitive channel protein [Cobetia marina]